MQPHTVFTHHPQNTGSKHTCPMLGRQSSVREKGRLAKPTHRGQDDFTVLDAGTLCKDGQGSKGAATQLCVCACPRVCLCACVPARVLVYVSARVCVCLIICAWTRSQAWACSPKKTPSRQERAFARRSQSPHTPARCITLAGKYTTPQSVADKTHTTEPEIQMGSEPDSGEDSEWESMKKYCDFC